MAASRYDTTYEGELNNLTTLLLLIIYLAFISLGLPDSLLGAVWPAMQPDLHAPLESAGLLYMTITAGTIASSLASGYILRRFQTGHVTTVSTLLTACALLGFAAAPSYLWLLPGAILLGLGAGAVDASLNNYVAAHYKASHMNWLHCLWGVGATLGPIITASFITEQHEWRQGYAAIACIQFALVLVLFISLPVWSRVSHVHRVAEDNAATRSTGSEDPFLADVPAPRQRTGTKLALASFLLYCGAETAVGLWGASFLVNVKEMDVSVAARWVSLFYAGIAVGRFLSGFVTMRLSNRSIIRGGLSLSVAGALLLLLPLPDSYSLAGFIIIGLGYAPIFPCMLHETPVRFGKRRAQKIIGYQMAAAFTGSAVLPPFIGYIASYSTIGILPIAVLLLIVVVAVCSEWLNRLFPDREYAELH